MGGTPNPRLDFPGALVITGLSTLTVRPCTRQEPCLHPTMREGVSLAKGEVIPDLAS
jgi:hypothetical protein